MALTLFIGGSADGQRMDVRKDYPDVCVPYAIPPIHLETDHKREVQIKTDFYRREKLYGKNRIFEVFLHKDLDADDLIEMLLESY